MFDSCRQYQYRVSSMVELRSPKPKTRVRFLHPVPDKDNPGAYMKLSSLMANLAGTLPDIELHDAEVKRISRLVTSIIDKMMIPISTAKPMPPLHAVSKIVYNPETGEFHKRLKNGALKPCGSNLSGGGYRRFEVWHDGKRYRVQANRMAWLLYYGVPPEEGMVIHHVDEDKKNNRISNLEMVRHSTNIVLSPVRP